MIQLSKKYGNWKVIKEVPRKNRKAYFLCLCNCGSEKEVRAEELIKEISQFCRNCRHASKEILPNQKFGKWTVLELVQAEEKRKHYKVQCDCGTIKILKGIRLRFGDSDGCRKCGSTKHNLAHSRTYTTWESMIQRCTNINNMNYLNYGGRGIKICKEWLLFENFLKDMGLRPDGLELDRIDNNGNYEPGNCRWITHQENLNNRNR